MNKEYGFTLIELMVAVSIFTIVTVFALTALMRLADANDRAQALLTALNNLDFAMDHMSRTIRVGRFWSCEPSCDAVFGTDNIRFLDVARKEYVEYWFIRAPEGGYGYVEKKYNNKTFAITAPEIDIKNLTFFVSTGVLDAQPRVLILINGQTQVDGVALEEQETFNLQTSISQLAPVESN